MADVNPILLLITLNMSGLNSLIKGQRLFRYDNKAGLKYSLFTIHILESKTQAENKKKEKDVLYQ